MFAKCMHRKCLFLVSQDQDEENGAVSEVSPSGRSANGPPSARSSAQEEEPAMILFDEDEDHPPQLGLGPPSAGGPHAGVERAARPSSAASSVSAASDLLCEGWPPGVSSNGGLRCARIPASAKQATVLLYRGPVAHPVVERLGLRQINSDRPVCTHDVYLPILSYLVHGEYMLTRSRLHSGRNMLC